MDSRHLDHRLTEEERIAFDTNGFFVVKQVLDGSLVSELNTAVDELELIYRPKLADKTGLRPSQPMNLLDFMGKDERFLPLIDWPKTFMKVVDILGWHIQLYHSHVIITPPLDNPQDYSNKRMGWHQDSGRINLDIESNPRPRISLKVGFFITDTTSTDRGNFHVLPGSHLNNKLQMPEDPTQNPEGAVPVQLEPGDAVFFDRRLWHAAGWNTSTHTRKALFYGYSYRWLKPRDNMTVDHYMDGADPVRKQLLGASPNGGFGFTSPADDDVPLKLWLAEHLGEDAVRP